MEKEGLVVRKTKNMEQINYQYGQGSCLLIKKLDLLLFPLYKIIPFTYANIYMRNFSDLMSTNRKITMIDLGCGHGGVVSLFRFPKKFEITGVDIYGPYVKLARKRGVYKEVFKADVRKIGTKKKYDIVLANHVLEHMSKKDGRNFLKKIEKIATKRVIIAAPIGEFPRGEVDSNSFQTHKSSWTVEEMRNLGYIVSAQGLKIFWRDENIVAKIGILSYLLFFVSLLCTPLLKIRPELGTYMICRKDI
jgi:ubiquinone/menaquinone biosynthesis C-methylase UbiE